MAAGFLNQLAGGRVEVLSAGSDPAGAVNAVAVQAMAELGVDLSKAQPRRLQDAEVRQADVVITMGCGDACQIYPGKRYEDWDLDDPAGRSLDDVRWIRDQIRGRVARLVKELNI